MRNYGRRLAAGLPKGRNDFKIYQDTVSLTSKIEPVFIIVCFSSNPQQGVCHSILPQVLEFLIYER